MRGMLLNPLKDDLLLLDLDVRYELARSRADYSQFETGLNRSTEWLFGKHEFHLGDLHAPPEIFNDTISKRCLRGSCEKVWTLTHG